MIFEPKEEGSGILHEGTVFLDPDSIGSVDSTLENRIRPDLDRKKKLAGKASIPVNISCFLLVVLVEGWRVTYLLRCNPV